LGLHARPEAVRDLFIVFTRYAEPGKVKTRLIPSLRASGASRLQREMTRHALRTARTLYPDIQVEVFCDGGDIPGIQDLFGPETTVWRQRSGDLGQRMADAFHCAFVRGFRRVVLTGTDCPSITSSIIRQAFDSLNSHDCVLGPADDGGYYLIGLRKPGQELLAGIPWGTSDVFKETVARAERIGFTASYLKSLPDIDRPDDLPTWMDAVRRTKPRIEVIIPTLNEETSIVCTLKQLGKGTNTDILVVDGGSSDRTATLAAGQDARVITSGRNRATQMNEGAARSKADILLFLHADTRLPENFDFMIREALADPCVIAGAFSLGFDSDMAALKLIAFGANLRSRLLEFPYGDQGIFLWSADFRESGGFPDLPIMEDAAFIRILRKQGRISILREKAITSARRYEQLGPLRTLIINQCVILSFLKGAGATDIASLYQSRAGLRQWLGLLICGTDNKPGLRRSRKRR
jgi:rSAM/selenodomain-associated transferase 2/rSAM/selenodomain-associated transferase 1